MGRYTIAKTLGLKHVSQRTVKPKDAVMFDIDDTLIHVDGTPIKEMISLIKTCMKLGYRIIIITARPDYVVNHTFTQIQLAKFNIPYNEVYFAPAEKKTEVKKHSGLNYVLSVGDMDTDIGHSEKFLKLPNYADPNLYSNIRLP
jgi:ribonucleotide monophosphatase NagD (HAD superfamily)